MGYNFQTLFSAIISFLTWIDIFKPFVIPMMVEKSSLQDRQLSIAAIEVLLLYVFIKKSYKQSKHFINSKFNRVPLILL